MSIRVHAQGTARAAAAPLLPQPATSWRRKDLLSLEELSRAEIELLLSTAESFKEVSAREVKKVPALRGKTIANMFFESSTRTRTSFELAAKRLSADVVNFQGSTSSVQKGESLIDTAKNIQAMQVDTVVVRHASSGAAELLARELEASVVNAGDGIHEHPTQGLLDIFTIREHLPLAGLHVCLVGDILHSRVARSNLWGLRKLGARVTVCGPPTLIPHGIEQLGATVSYDLDEVIEDADVVNILRIQFERQHGAFFPSVREYAVEYGLSRERLARAKPHLLVLQPRADEPRRRGGGRGGGRPPLADPGSGDQRGGGAHGGAVPHHVDARAGRRRRRGRRRRPGRGRDEGGVTMQPVLVQGGRLVDPANGVNALLDLLAADGRVRQLGADLSAAAAAAGAEVIDARGKLVLPGLIDVHVHLRQPGFEYKETIESGLRAALAGGFTGVCPMPNTNPVSDSRADMEFLRREARRLDLINLWPVGAVTVRQEGRQLTEFGELRTGGAVALSDDGKPIVSSAILRRALEYARKFDLPLMLHEEDPELSLAGALNEGVVATRLGLLGSPCQAESAMVARDVEIAALAGGRIHFQHISCGRSVQLIRQARAAGIEVSAETCPHYLFLTEEAVLRYNTNAKMYPPLRTAADVAAVRAGVADGTITIVGSDHAPHADYEKAVEFDQAPNGITGVETMLPLMLALEREGVISLEQLVRTMAVQPARLIGVQRGSLEVGAVADVTVVDPAAAWVYDDATALSKSRNSPFWGASLTGRASDCLVAGRVRLRAGRIADPAPEQRDPAGVAV